MRSYYLFFGEVMKMFKELYDYIYSIRKLKRVDIYSIVNATLIANPYISKFPEAFLFDSLPRKNFSSSLILNIFLYYIYNAVRLINYLAILFFFKRYYNKKLPIVTKNCIILDLYVNVESVVNQGEFSDKYFGRLYSVLEEENRNYIFIPRLIGVSSNPFKACCQLVSFFKIMSLDRHLYIFEFEFFSGKHFFKLLQLYLLYPFRTLNLLSKNNTASDKVFNFYLKKDISKQSIVPFTRYIFGKNLNSVTGLTKIYSWSEFQVTERAFNFGLRKVGGIKVTACQFLVTYPSHFNMHVQDIDEEQGSAPSLVLVNGPQYVLERSKVNYQVGVSLRYDNVYRYRPRYDGSQVLVLGSYSLLETTNILKMVNGLDGAIFKSHPAVGNLQFSRFLNERIRAVDGNIYDLFPRCALVVGSASGSLVEAIACGVSVLLIARENELVTNPMSDVGKGKIWDLAYSSSEVTVKIAELIAFRSANKDEIVNISGWYRDNFFVEPSSEKIRQTFRLDSSI